MFGGVDGGGQIASSPRARTWTVGAIGLAAGAAIGFAIGYGVAGFNESTLLDEGAFLEPRGGVISRPSAEPVDQPAASRPFTEARVDEPARIDPELLVSPDPPAEPAARRPEPPPSPEPRRQDVQRTANGRGSLQVLSRPAGAQVFLDGRPAGRTPVVVSDVRTGEYDVRLELAGFRRWATSVRVVSGERTRVAASLEQ